MAKITDTQLQYYREVLAEHNQLKKQQTELLAKQDQERRIYKKRLFWSRCEIWAYRIGIVAGGYFLLK